MPDLCTSLHIDNYNNYYLRSVYIDSTYKMLLNNIENLFGANATVRLSRIRGLEIHNTMKEVKPSVFSSLKTLLHLNLANNFIEYVNKDAFIGLDQLRELILSENIIQFLPLAVFNNLKELQSLSLANNKMTVLNFDNFQFNQQLVLLDVSSNQLTTLLASLDKLNRMRVRTLLLDHNNLTDISVLHELPQLISLNVSDNQLRDVEILNLQALRDIDISQNLWDCKYLSILLQYLSKRKISTPKREVINSPNVNGIGCFGPLPVGSVEYQNVKNFAFTKIQIF
jgi:Leucine-rich repeat (LRR) protein